jgi:thiol:disulfide interchange protein DsbD
MKKYVSGFILYFILLPSLTAQMYDPVSWSIQHKKVSDQVYNITLEANIEEGWHLYGTNIPEGGPIATSLIFSESENYELQGELNNVIEPVRKMDPTFDMELELFDGKAAFSQQIQVTQSPAVIEVTVEYMCCDDNRCLPPTEKTLTTTITGTSSANDKTQSEQHADNKEESSPSFEFEQAEKGHQFTSPDTVKDEIVPAVDQEVKHAAKEGVEKTDTNTREKTTKKADRSLWAIFIASLLGGFAGILTPCVYPMIPMTVSFFMRGDKSKSKALVNGLFFGFSIIAIYTLIGVLIAVFKNNFIGSIVNHWLTNLIFFALFLVFAISFFGAFEIVLPSGLANKVDQRADKAGLLGPFFMALTTVIVSFSCTGPIIGALLVKAAQGQVLEPIVGMFGFSLIFATPFTIFAIFPGMMQSLPKSGGWLNAVKVFLGFIVLAFSMVFLITAFPQLLSRELYLSIWIALAIMLTAYLWGKIKFPHDSDLPHISITRAFISIAVLSFAIYLSTGFFGNKLTTLGAMLPAKTEITTPVGTYSDGESAIKGTYPGICGEPKYSDIDGLGLPHGLQGYFDYQEGLACAKEQNKPLLLDFKGHYCKNCKDMEMRVWSDTQVLNRLRNDFVIVAFYTDDQTTLPESQWYTSSVDGKVKKTLGKQHADFQAEKFKTNAIPLYAIVDHNGDLLTSDTYAYDPDVDAFLNWLNEGVENFEESH